MHTTGVETGRDAAARMDPAEVALEREKLQIERERLALERERWSAERDKRASERAMSDLAAGRVTLSIGALALALLTALLAGGSTGAWLNSLHSRRSQSQVAASLIQALGSETNGTAHAESRLLRTLGTPGRGGGYLLILE